MWLNQFQNSMLLFWSSCFHLSVTWINRLWMQVHMTTCGFETMYCNLEVSYLINIWLPFACGRLLEDSSHVRVQENVIIEGAIKIHSRCGMVRCFRVCSCSITYDTYKPLHGGFSLGVVCWISITFYSVWLYTPKACLTLLSLIISRGYFVSSLRKLWQWFRGVQSNFQHRRFSWLFLLPYFFQENLNYSFFH